MLPLKIYANVECCHDFMAKMNVGTALVQNEVLTWLHGFMNVGTALCKWSFDVASWMLARLRYEWNVDVASWQKWSVDVTSWLHECWHGIGANGALTWLHECWHGFKCCRDFMASWMLARLRYEWNVDVASWQKWSVDAMSWKRWILAWLQCK